MIDIDIHTLFPGLDPALEKILSNRLQLFAKACENQPLSKGVIKDVPERFKSDFARAMLFSEFIAARFTRSPRILEALLSSRDLYSEYPPGRYLEKLLQQTDKLDSESKVQSGLLEFKLYESVRIAWRDLNSLAGLSETLENLSDLADACLQKVLDTVYAKCCGTYGIPVDQNENPQEMVVLGMGKLGARELNFSSDIDLIFVFPRSGRTTGDRHVTNEEFFTKVCLRFLKMFDAASLGATFYRVDNRLRPFGAGGPLVMSSAAFEAYYEAQGREWERYAMIKARPVAGNITEGRRLLGRLNSFVYRRYFDYGTFDSFRDMKARISLQVKNKKFKSNIKLGPGGIREIEFFCQLFQLIRGGVEPDLQERSLLKVLDTLNRHGSINETTWSDLRHAYIFFRKVENRLQAYADLQTHDLPSCSEQLLILALSMGYDTVQDLVRDVSGHMARVHGHFNELLVSEEERSRDARTKDFKQLWFNINDPQFDEEAFDITGFDNPKEVLNALRTLEEHPNTRRMTASGRKKLGRLVPLILQKLTRCEQPGEVLHRLIDLVITIERRTCYLSLLIENKGALENLIRLAAKSQWIVSFLARHPMLLDELLNPASLYSPPGMQDLHDEIENRFSRIQDADTEYLLEELSVFKQINTLRVAAADISGDYPLMKVSDHLTYIAQIVLEKVLDISWQMVVARYGLPEGVSGDDQACCGFGIVAYGKVGGFEMGYKSDIDLVFLYKGTPGLTLGPKQIDNNMFYSNLGQRIINALTMHTAAGTLYKADMRLRPGGTAGLIVSHIDAFEEYMEQQAWTWEHQALIKARPVCGDQDLVSMFNSIRSRVLKKERPPEQLKDDICQMRERLRKEHLKREPGLFDIKQGEGGLLDIEFLVQYLVLRYGAHYPDVTVWTDNIRLLESLITEGILLPETGEMLQSAYLEMRREIHRLNLMDRPVMAPEEMFEKTARQVIEVKESLCCPI